MSILVQGVTVASVSNIATTAFSLLQGSFTAVSTSETISFLGYDNPDFLNLDTTNLSLAAAPELDSKSAAVPTALALGGLLLLGDRRRRQKE